MGEVGGQTELMSSEYVCICKYSICVVREAAQEAICARLVRK